jgi:hypothetical protein
LILLSRLLFNITLGEILWNVNKMKDSVRHRKWMTVGFSRKV